MRTGRELYRMTFLCLALASFCCEGEDPEPEPEPKPEIVDCKRSHDYLKATINAKFNAIEIKDYMFYADACDGTASRGPSKNGPLVIYCYLQFDRKEPFEGTIDDYFKITLDNVSTKGVYSFGIDPMTGGSISCEYSRRVAGWDLFSYSTALEGAGPTDPQGPGTITIDSISSSFIRGSFSAVLLSPQDTLAQATITNGIFEQGIE